MDKGGGTTEAEGGQEGEHISLRRRRVPPEPLPDLLSDGSGNPPLARARVVTKILAALGTPIPDGPDGSE